MSLCCFEEGLFGCVPVDSALKRGVLVPRLFMGFADVGQHRDVPVAVNDQRLHIRFIVSTMDNELGIHAEEAGFVV